MRDFQFARELKKVPLRKKSQYFSGDLEIPLLSLPFPQHTPHKTRQNVILHAAVLFCTNYTFVTLSKLEYMEQRSQFGVSLQLSFVVEV